MPQMEMYILQSFLCGAKFQSVVDRIAAGKQPAKISQNKAWKIYSRTAIEKLVKKGKINPLYGSKKNSKTLYDVIEIEKALLPTRILNTKTTKK